MGYASLVLYLRILPSFTDPVLGSVPSRLCLRNLRPECESYQSRAHTNQFDISYDRKRIHRPLFNGGVLLRYDLYSCYAIAHSEYRVSKSIWLQDFRGLNIVWQDMYANEANCRVSPIYLQFLR